MIYSKFRTIVCGSLILACQIAFADKPWIGPTETITKTGDCRAHDRSELRNSEKIKDVEHACYRDAIAQSFSAAKKTTDDEMVSVVGWNKLVFTRIKMKAGAPKILTTQLVNPEPTQIAAVAIDLAHEELFVLDRIDAQEHQVLVYRLGAGGMQAPIRVLIGEGLNFASDLQLDLKAVELLVVSQKLGLTTAYTREASSFGGDLAKYRQQPLRSTASIEGLPARRRR